VTRFVLAIPLVLLVACFQNHPADQRLLSGSDCFMCHTDDYAATAAPAPVHRDMPDVFSTACTNCHQQTDWRPALEGRHSEVFAIAQGVHAQIACQDCHVLSTTQTSKLGANTNCLTCHPNDAGLTSDHTGVTLFDDTPYAYQATVPNFCLQCHPSGTAEVHPDDKFARKATHAVLCTECHDRSAGPDTGGKNVTCVESRCHHTVAATDHTDGHKDGDYQKSRGDGKSKTYCHDCHN
jgi:hypothetical protein